MYSVIPSALKKNLPKARIEHLCVESGTVIQIGEKYAYYSGVWDGESRVYKMCLEMDQLYDKCVNSLPPGDGEDYPALGYLQQFIFDGEFGYGEEGNNQIRGHMETYIKICEARGGKVTDWMRKKLTKYTKTIN